MPAGVSEAPIPTRLEIEVRAAVALPLEAGIRIAERVTEPSRVMGLYHEVKNHQIDLEAFQAAGPGHGQMPEERTFSFVYRDVRCLAACGRQSAPNTATMGHRESSQTQKGRLNFLSAVHYVERARGDSFWAVTRHEDITTVGRQPELFSSKRIIVREPRMLKQRVRG